ncbi:Aste57867_4629 [Aphanomyces stellatus]|uniref:Aste57867_4629 protein n=1 Tax=Aphanomyces stellatus TaxID=120398 RepID=A0A485KC20_9STRA|nr:hypothetical protein As57867_004616 [Aphanomyces stellatus]VFT81733.1 Aste57867_4629 [Aphanomyces stellatus]
MAAIEEALDFATLFGDWNSSSVHATAMFPSSHTPASLAASSPGLDSNDISYLEKLYMILESCSPAVAAWTNNGTSLTIYNSDAFEQSGLPLYFKPIKFQSFARQLNAYNFKKTQTWVHRRKVYEFSHSLFVRGKFDQIKSIPRRRPRSPSLDGDAIDERVNLRSTVGDLIEVTQRMQSELAAIKGLVHFMTPPRPSSSPLVDLVLRDFEA